MNKLLLSIMILSFGLVSTGYAKKSASIKEARKTVSTETPGQPIDDATRTALRKIAADRQIEITPILAQKHAAIRRVMDDNTLSLEKKKASIKMISADFDEIIAAVFTQNSTKIEKALTPTTSRSMEPRK